MSKKTYTYYPGCSLQHGNHAYEVSNQAVAEALGFGLEAIDDWNCCGATEYFSLNRLPAYALVARNLARASDGGADEVIAPCSACFLNLFKTDKHMKLYPELNEKVNGALEAGNLKYEPGSLTVRHLLEAIITDVGFDALKDRVRRPLYGLNLAPYYGCLVARPDSVFDSTEQPTMMDKMFEVLGAEATTFHLKTFCCGGHMTQISEDTALEMIHKIVKNAADNGADAIVTICPMCQLNLDVYQGYANDLFGTEYEIPVMFFTQVIGLALGLSPKELGFGQEFVNMSSLVDKIQDAPPPKARRTRRPKEALPMPVMPE
jgi:heterodisulfide reductase subunit B